MGAGGVMFLPKGKYCSHNDDVPKEQWYGNYVQEQVQFDNSEGRNSK